MSLNYFFIGTEAELIKVFPVIMECQKKGNTCHIIASGQNDLTKNRILSYIGLNGKYVELSKEESIKKSAAGLIIWFIKTKMTARRRIVSEFGMDNLKGHNMIVHGDTVSTYMGALVGKSLGMRVCHVEAGLRSHNLLNPFPEEIDRLLTSRIARLHFAPGDEAEKNLSKAKGNVVNTKYNTILDSLAISREMPIVTDGLGEALNNDYFVFVMHRQENLMNTDYFNTVLDKIINLSEKKRCALILHKITENKLIELGRLDELKNNPNFILFPRVDYFDFMKLLDNSKFVITDGGSNQEELHYMGKPCLIMRKTTERSEGIGENARLVGDDISILNTILDTYTSMKAESIDTLERPSCCIARFLIGANLWEIK